MCLKSSPVSRIWDSLWSTCRSHEIPGLETEDSLAHSMSMSIGPSAHLLAPCCPASLGGCCVLRRFCQSEGTLSWGHPLLLEQAIHEPAFRSGGGECLIAQGYQLHEHPMLCPMAKSSQGLVVTAKSGNDVGGPRKTLSQLVWGRVGDEKWRGAGVVLPTPLLFGKEPWGVQEL